MADLERPLTARFTHALALAANIHRLQARKGTQVPYMAHILGVAAIALEHGANEEEAIAAILHDAFFTGVSLKRVSAAGGPVRIVVDYLGTYGGAGGTWASDGTIVFSGQFDLFRVPADGGAMTVVTKAPTQDWSYYWPSFLPDGRRFLFTAKLWTRTAEASDQGIHLGSVDNPKIERLLPDLSSAVYAPLGYLVFVAMAHSPGCRSIWQRAA
jgi:hypothetical protein